MSNLSPIRVDMRICKDEPGIPDNIQTRVRLMGTKHDLARYFPLSNYESDTPSEFIALEELRTIADMMEQRLYPDLHKKFHGMRDYDEAHPEKSLYDKWIKEKSCLVCGSSWNGGANCAYGPWCVKAIHWKPMPFEVFCYYQRRREEMTTPELRLDPREQDEFYCPVCGAENPEMIYEAPGQGPVGCDICLSAYEPWDYYGRE